MVDPPPEKIIYVHYHAPPSLDGVPIPVELKTEIQQEDLSPDRLGHKRTILVLDDVFQQMPESLVYAIFTSISHHSSCSVLCVLQAIFLRTRISRVASYNAHYFTLCKSPRDLLSVRFLNSQIFPNSKGFLP